MDNLPVWFLRLGAPIFYKPLTYLFNLSLSSSVVPVQWKLAWIRPVPKVSAPAQHSDYRPISITTVLTRMLERLHLPSHSQTASGIILLGPVCLQAHRLNHSNQHNYPSHSHTSPCIQPIRHSNCYRLL